MNLYRQAYHQSKIYPRMDWRNGRSGAGRSIDLLRRHTQNLLDTSQPPEDHDELLKRGEIFIERG